MATEGQMRGDGTVFHGDESRSTDELTGASTTRGTPLGTPSNALWRSATRGTLRF